MTEPVRRQIEQPSEEKARRSGCLLLGAILGVIFGIMLGIYALPPILRHYYGEEEVAPYQQVTVDGKTMSLESLTVPEAPQATPAAGMRAFEVHASFLVVTEEDWAPTPQLFTVEIEGVSEWQLASRVAIAEDNQDRIVANMPTTLMVEFSFSLPENDAPVEIVPEAIHLSEPRIEFKAPPP